MNLKPNEIVEDTRAYYSEDFGERILEELFFNAYRTIQSVYIFKYFDEYVTQLKGDNNEDKKEVYWNASYGEKLTDYVKISIAFENFNKASLIRKGYLVHKIQKSQKTKDFFKRQNYGEPIKIDDFKTICGFTRKNPLEKYSLDGFQKGLPTINYSRTLSDSYQEIIGLDRTLLYRLKELNEKRNKLHFFTDFKGAFEVRSHIDKWRYIKESSIAIIEREINKTNTKKNKRH